MLQWQHHVWKIAMNWKKTWKKHGKNKPVWFCFAKGSRFHRSHELNKIKLVFSGPRLKTWGTQCAMMWIRAPRNVKPAISMWKWIGSWDGNPGSKTTRITTAWLMDTWTVLDDYSETGKKIIKNQVTSVGIHWRAEPICLRAAAELARRDRGSLIHSRASLIRWRGLTRHVATLRES